ncbi:MAG TPA: PAS domain S-box protein, partial [Bacteroidota bacterium]|nr:PAS domain S-box protein [Bacteroidota bacterium]
MKQTRKSNTTPLNNFEHAVELSGDAVFTTDNAGLFTYVNPEFTHLYGFTFEEVVGKQTPEILRSTYGQVTAEGDWKTLLRDGETKREIVNRSKDGHFIFIEGFSTPIRDEDGKETGHLVIQRNITEQKRSGEMEMAVYRIAEVALSSSGLEELFKSVHQIISDVISAKNFFIALYDESSNLIFFPYYVDQEDDVPTPRKPKRGMTEYVLRTGKSILVDRLNDDSLMRAGEIELIGKRSAIWMGVPLKIGKKTIGVMALQHYSDPKAYGPRELQMIEHISSQVAATIETKRASAALQASEQRFYALFARLMDGVYRSTHEGKFVEINDAMVRMFRYANKEEMLKIDIKKDLYFAADDRESHFLDTGQEKIEVFRMRRKDGTEVWVEDHGQYVHDAEGKVIYHEGILRDVTERIKIEESLRESEYRFRLVIEQTGQVVYDCDVQSGLREWSGAIEQVTGYKGDEFQSTDSAK